MRLTLTNPDAEPMAALGGVLFKPENLSFTEMELTHTYEWRQVKSLVAVWHEFAALEQASKLTIKGSFVSSFHRHSKEHNLEKLITLAGKGEPVSLTVCSIDGARTVGKFVIRSIHESRSIFDAHGVPRKLDFTVELESYGQ